MCDILFPTRSLISRGYYTLRLHLSLDKPYFKCSVAHVANDYCSLPTVPSPDPDLNPATSPSLHIPQVFAKTVALISPTLSHDVWVPPFSVPGAGRCPDYWPSYEAPLPGFEFIPHCVQLEQVIRIFSEPSIDNRIFPRIAGNAKRWCSWNFTLSVISSVAKYSLPPLPSPPPPPPRVLMWLEKTCPLFLFCSWGCSLLPTTLYQSA